MVIYKSYFNLLIFKPCFIKKFFYAISLHLKLILQIRNVTFTEKLTMVIYSSFSNCVVGEITQNKSFLSDYS